MNTFEKICEDVKVEAANNKPMFQFVKDLVFSEPFNYKPGAPRRISAQDYIFANRQIKSVFGDVDYLAYIRWTSNTIRVQYPEIGMLRIDEQNDDPTTPKKYYILEDYEWVYTSFSLDGDPRELPDETLKIIESAKRGWLVVEKFQAIKDFNEEQTVEALEFLLESIDEHNVSVMHMTRREILKIISKYKQLSNIELSAEDWGRML